MKITTAVLAASIVVLGWSKTMAVGWTLAWEGYNGDGGFTYSDVLDGRVNQVSGAGTFNMRSVNSYTSPSGVTFNSGIKFQTWCTDIGRTIQTQTDYLPRNFVSSHGDNPTPWLGSIGLAGYLYDQFVNANGSLKAGGWTSVGLDPGQTSGGVLTSAAKAAGAGIQLAIWEILYTPNGQGYDIHHGNFSVSAGDANAINDAQALLTYLTAHAPPPGTLPTSTWLDSQTSPLSQGLLYPPTPGLTVPDGGLTALLLGFASITLVLVERRARRA